ncbi:hypothetical protein [Cohnella candidum]|uniref:Uncharacterized protein n=1 Tax=Cohnella candidum TaxID=2674991 RepID=A0A3G3K549_9BACL|nr:hypothetical protein [Cohnella candidum]AYQ74879.1 hypothetical protein EAV92_21390 [Cohnella candidum]
MPLVVCVFIAWLTIILFAITPKRLSILDVVFLYGIVLSLTATSYTILDLNFHYISIPKNGTALLAATVYRVITVPLFILLALNALQTPDGRKPQWGIPIVIWVGLTLFDWALNRFKIISYHYSFVWPVIGIGYLGLFVILWGLTSWYKRFDQRKEGHA